MPVKNCLLLSVYLPVETAEVCWEESQPPPRPPIKAATFLLIGICMANPGKDGIICMFWGVMIFDVVNLLQP